MDSKPRPGIGWKMGPAFSLPELVGRNWWAGTGGPELVGKKAAAEERYDFASK
jgi:hypothetical protein